MIGNQQKTRLQGESGLTPLTEPVADDTQLFKLKGPWLV
jgi:hypothetical protein